MPSKVKKTEEKPEEVKKKESILEAADEPESQDVKSPKIASFSQLDSKTQDSETTEAEEKKPESLEIQEPTPPNAADIPPQEKASPEFPQNTNEPAAEKSSDDIKEWLKDIRPDTTKEIEKKGKFSFKVFFILLIMFAIVGAVVGGLFYYKDSMKQEPESKDETFEEPKAQPTAVPTEALKEEVDLKTFNLSVLNGSGVSGEAAKVKTLLSGVGFDPAKITAGNADSAKYEKTVVSYKENVQGSVFKQIETALNETYDVELKSEKLKDNSSYDIIVIVGSKK